MPVIPPANTQQVLQMSSAVEKVQTQQVQHLAGSQADMEQLQKLENQKSSEIQEPEETHSSEATDPDSGPRQRHIRIKKTAEKPGKEEDGSQTPSHVPEEIPGGSLNVII